MEFSIDIVELIVLIFGSGGASAWGVLKIMKLWHKKEYRLLQNLKRPIMIFKGPEVDMEIETDLLEKVGLFRVDEKPTDKHQLATDLDGYGLVIIGYSEKMDNFEDIFNRVMQQNIPIIVYSKGKLPDVVFNELRDKYNYYSTCQVPLRLVNDVLGILSTFPHEENGRKCCH